MTILAPKYLNKNLANAILAIIKGQVHPKTVNAILTTASQKNITPAVTAATDAAAAGHAPNNIHTVVKDSSSRNLVNKLVALITTPIKPANTTGPLKPANTVDKLRKVTGWIKHE